jgi:hypothetical protein
MARDKGCDIGYALAINSREGANSVETSTVPSLDAIMRLPELASA